MRNTDFMNLSLPEGADKIDVEILNSDFTAIENLLKQHAIIETMTLNGEGVIIGAIGPYIRLQNIDAIQVSIDIGEETYTLASGENVIIRETAENIGIITSGDVHITYFVNPKTYADKEFYTKEKVDELLSEATIEVDAELSDVSENPVQNKVITQELANYASDIETANSAIQKNTNDIANKLTYGQVTLYVDSVNGSDDNVGTSSTLAFKTLQKAIDYTNQHQNIVIILNNGEYVVNSWNIYNKKIRIQGESIDNTVMKITGTLRADNCYFDLYRFTLDTTNSANNNPIVITYGSVLRGASLNITTTKHDCIRSYYESYVYLANVKLSGATYAVISAVNNSEVEVVNCTNNTTSPILINEGGAIRMWDSEFEYNVANGFGEVYKDGVQVYPVDISSLLARIEALETTTTTEGGE